MSVIRLILVAICACGEARAVAAQSAFYRALVSEVAGAAGALVRQEVINGAPLGATAYRMLY